MPSLPDTAVIILLGLLLFGPKGLAQIARQLGKLMGEFRRASHEFRMQMEEELRISEQADRQKEIARAQAETPIAAQLAPAPTETELEEHPHLRSQPAALPEASASPETAQPLLSEPLPIATSGELQLLPPATGLPEPRSSSLVPRVEPQPRPESIDPAGPAANGTSDTSHLEEDQRPMRYTNGHADPGVSHHKAAEESIHG